MALSYMKIYSASQWEKCELDLPRETIFPYQIGLDPKV